MKKLAILPLLAAVLCAAPLFSRTAAAEDPDFGPNVILLSPDTPDLQAKISEISKKMDGAQFSSNRYALFFKPGKYKAEVLVGFYTSINGLGKSPDDVDIQGQVHASARWMGGNATCNFWRSVENISFTSPKAANWAVSQGTSFRHSHVKGDLNLWEGGWSSGGFLADTKIDGTIASGSQQQWLSRNSDWKKWNGGNWNMVFVGDPNAPADAFPGKPITTVAKAPIIREKPYLVFDADKYYIEVPPLLKDAAGTSWDKPGKQIKVEDCYIAKDKTDTAATMNAALAAGKSLILTPGIYHLDEAIKVTKPNTVVLGLGYATLIPDKGTPAITVADVDGVSICGVLLEASMKECPTLLEVGEAGSKADHAANPTAVYDIFCRNGGANNGLCSAMVTINSNDVIGDNFWLWRADHGAGAGWNSNKNKNAMIVNGKDVTIYGLFCEHAQEYQTLWNADGGRVYFYQSELPYDPPSTDAWSHGDVKGYASYKVADNVKTHEAWGLGVYSVFKNDVVSDTAIEAPDAPGIKFHHMVTLKLSKGGLLHILNKTGGPSGAGGPMKATLE